LLSICIGGNLLRLDVPNTDGVISLKKVFAPYLCENSNESFSPLLDLKIEVLTSKVKTPLPGRVESTPIKDDHIHSIRFDMPTFSGIIKYEANRYEGIIQVYRDEVPWYNDAIWLSLSAICASKGEILLHASGVIIDKKVWLFCGPSGTGKTTIAMDLNGHGEPFSIDRVFIRPNADGTLTAFSTPIGSELSICLEARSAAIDGICFIEQSRHHNVSPMSSHEVVSAVLRQVACYSRDPFILGKVMNTISLIAERYSCYYLRFKKDANFWPLLFELKGSSR
jgi:hypothetical protein